jgi:hypothetical protein
MIARLVSREGKKKNFLSGTNNTVRASKSFRLLEPKNISSLMVLELLLVHIFISRFFKVDYNENAFSGLLLARLSACLLCSDRSYPI